ncbi:MAG: DUF1080 domain-containing protein [Planctomycetota bacterium]|nr:DUF1080 domain-containing protein [Planctomycetota bacterium]
MLVRFVLVLTVILSSVASQKKPKKKVWDNPSEAAKQDPDFRLQGEYARPGLGVHVIARGNSKFQIVTYRGGLPGLGSDGKAAERQDSDTAAVRKLLAGGFQKIHRKSVTLGAKPPRGATVLFDGTKESLGNWKKGARITEDGLLMQGVTSVPTFGDHLVHVEFRLPYQPHARGQGRGNSGLYVQGRYETQMLDSFGLKGMHNECGGIYSIRAPDLNACLPPLTWQTYDIEYKAARFGAGGKKLANARMTVRLNGIVIHPDVELPKRTTASPLKEGDESGPVYLQNHGNPVRYRNIWVLPRSSK